MISAFGSAESKLAVSSKSPKSSSVAITSSSSLHKCKQQNHFVLDLLFNIVDAAQTTSNNVVQQWHARLGHPASHVLKCVLNKI